MPAASRAHDIVLFGATGFTGALTAEYLARQPALEGRWALAGRNQGKLEALRDKLGLPDLPLLHADSEDPKSLREAAEATKVLITTVGPYIRYGEPIVEACAEAGTDYTDLTGEPEFVDLMYARHNARAAATGARLVHACGFDSIPHDMGALFAVEQLPEGVPIKLEGFVRANGTFSGGTLDSALTAFSRVRGMAKAASERRRIEPSPPGRKVRGIRGLPRHESAVGAWVLPAPTIDPQIVLRSARALDRYGPDFSYGHYAAIKRLPAAVGTVGGFGALFAAAQLPPVRKFLSGRRKPGEGPSAERIAKGWFNVRFLGEGGGKRVITETSGGDPGYGDTAKMLGEAALCLAHDELPETAGQVTTAEAMGDTLIARLKAAGFGFEVIEA